jgi:hypothetical protein
MVAMSLPHVYDAPAVRAFLAECCVIDPIRSVYCEDLFLAWKEWAFPRHVRAITRPRFGVDLRIVVPSLRKRESTRGRARAFIYEGIGLRAPSATTTTTT